MNSIHSIVDLLAQHAKDKGSQLAYSFHHFPKNTVDRLTFSELNKKSQTMAAALQQSGLQGRNVLLIFSPGLGFITTFCACLLAGIIPIPMSPPRGEKAQRRLLATFNDAEAAAILADTRIAPVLGLFLQQQALTTQIPIIDVNTLPQNPAPLLPVQVSLKDTAFIQYTSGSTDAPKGVVISHGNILHNEAMIQSAFEHDQTSSVVGWLPMYHDMGLIGNILQPLYLGIHSILMDPLAFVQKPVRWLQLISTYQASTSGSPNFGYDHCVKYIKDEDKKDLDLSSWSLAFSGSEPVRSKTMSKFADSFASAGFNKNAFYPCYGMAESTLMVSGSKKMSGWNTLRVNSLALSKNKLTINDKSDNTQELVSSGYAADDQIIKIVHPETLQACEQDQIGEIWLSSKSSATGYWNRRQLSQQTFEATQPNQSDNFLRTGDLGFLYQGQLFVTGRLKDAIIIRGKNHYPQDIEESSFSSHPNLIQDGTAAFAIDNNKEELLIVLQEVDHRKVEDFDLIKQNIQQAISAQQGLKVHKVVLIEARSLPRTSSGKLQRYHCKQQYVNQQLRTIKTVEQ